MWNVNIIFDSAMNFSFNYSILVLTKWDITIDYCSHMKKNINFIKNINRIDQFWLPEYKVITFFFRVELYGFYAKLDLILVWSKYFHYISASCICIDNKNNNENSNNTFKLKAIHWERRSFVATWLQSITNLQDNY